MEQETVVIWKSALIVFFFLPAVEAFVCMPDSWSSHSFHIYIQCIYINPFLHERKRLLEWNSLSFSSCFLSTLTNSKESHRALRVQTPHSSNLCSPQSVATESLSFRCYGPTMAAVNKDFGIQEAGWPASVEHVILPVRLLSFFSL